MTIKDAEEWLESRLTMWIPEPNTGCYVWMGALLRYKPNYGRPIIWRTVDSKYKHVMVAKFVCELTYGPMKIGEQSRHLCHFDQCVNPYHIKPGTQSENLRDHTAEERSARSKKSASSMTLEKLALKNAKISKAILGRKYV